MRKYLLSIDNGGTYIKAALFDLKGNQLGISKHHNAAINGGEGHTEYDQRILWSTNCRCIREVVENTGILPGEIACVGFAGQGKGLYMVDANGEDFRNAITSADVRAASYCDQWRADGTSQSLFPKLYQMAQAGQTVPILRWMKDHEPENYRRIRWVFSMKDLLFYRLTGTAIAGKGSQSGTCLVNLNTGEYDPELLDAYGIPEVASKLPPLKWDTEMCGTVSEIAAQQCGLAAGTPVSAGMFDVDASAIAMGVINSDAVFMISGTHSINGYIAPAPVTNGTVMLNSLYSLPGQYLVEEGSVTSAGVLEWVIDKLFAEATDRAEVYDRINRMVGATRPESSKLVFLPFLHGSRDSVISRGAWIGLCPEHNREEMLRAVYEGVVFAHKMHAEHLFANRKKPEKIRIAGGATQSEVWMQIFADAFQIAFEIVDDAEMGAKGVAIASAVAAGLYPDIDQAVHAMTRTGRTVSPNPEHAQAYERKFAAFKAVVGALDDVWKILAE